MAQLAVALSPYVDRLVVDRTGLSGSFDLDLEFIPGPQRPASEQSIYSAVQEQLGLRLDPQTGKVDEFVVDSAERPKLD